MWFDSISVFVIRREGILVRRDSCISQPSPSFSPRSSSMPSSSVPATQHEAAVRKERKKREARSRVEEQNDWLWSPMVYTIWGDNRGSKSSQQYFWGGMHEMSPSFSCFPVYLSYHCHINFFLSSHFHPILQHMKTYLSHPFQPI